MSTSKSTVRPCKRCQYAAICLPGQMPAKLKLILYWRRKTGASLADAKQHVERTMKCTSPTTTS